MTEPTELLPCPFCGGSVELEETTSYYNEMHGNRQWWGVVCRNTTNRGGSCAIQQRPSASKEASIDRWNRRTAPPAVAGEQTMADVIAACNGTEAFGLIMGLRAQVALLEAVIDEQKASAKSQPTQAQAGAVPLKSFTTAQVERLYYNTHRANCDVSTLAAFRRVVALIESSHGIKGGQHGTDT